MALHKDFPESPYAILDPDVRWFPADKALQESSAQKLMLPLVPQLRKKVKEWSDNGYVGATDTSKSLLNWWFNTPHLLPRTDATMAEFQRYFAQREALETIIYLYDVVGVHDKFDMMRCQICDTTDRRFGQNSGAQSGYAVRSLGDLPETARTAVMKYYSLEGAVVLEHFTMLTSKTRRVEL